MIQEDENMLKKTMGSLTESIAYLIDQNEQKWDGNDQKPWRRVTVCIIIDGLHADNENMLGVLRLAGLYDTGLHSS